MALTLTVAPDMFSFPLRTRVTVSAAGSVNTPVKVVRVHDDGSEWPVLTEASPRLIGGSWVGWDYHMPLGVQVQYRASTAAETSALASTFLAVETGVWLIPPDEPELAVRVEYTDGFGDDSYDVPAGVFDVIDSPYSVSVPEWGAVTVGVKSSIVVAVLRQDRSALERLLKRGGPLLIQAAARTGWDVTWRWIQPTGHTISNPGANTMPKGSAGYPYRNATIAYAQIQQPDVDVTPLWTDADAEAYWASQGVLTCAGVEAKYATDRDMETDTRL